MMTPPDPAPEPRPSSGSRVLLLVALIVLSAVGLLACAGALVAPVVMVRFRAAAQQEQAERNREQVKEALKKAAHDAATQQENAAEPEPGRTPAE